MFVPCGHCWERADLLALVRGVQLWVCHVPIGILGQVWYLIVSIPDLWTLTYYVSWSTSELRLNIVKPSSDFRCWPFQGGVFLLFMFHVYPCFVELSVPCSLVVTCWKWAGLLCIMFLVFYDFPIWRFEPGMVLDCIHIPNHCLPFYFVACQQHPRNKSAFCNLLVSEKW